MTPYNKATVATIKGTVTSVDTVFNKVQQEDGLHVTIKTRSGEYIVHVCPQWFADKQHITFKKGESLTIFGSTFIKDGQPNIYAATIESDEKTLKLRNPENGDRLWSGRYRNY
ncbi:MAG: hypothetical protein GY866_00730 [Proteobacteria bacterium]|nr:hypothetical protein [Pseudomonadota bacterium]